MREHAVNFFFALSLFLLFAVVTIGCVAMGANIYKNTAETMDENYDVRTSVFYIQEKVRQNSGGVSVGDDGKSLILTDIYNDAEYQTIIFLGNKTLREVTVAPDTPINPGDGQSIMALQDLEFTVEGDLLLIEVKTLDEKGFTGCVELEGKS